MGEVRTDEAAVPHDAARWQVKTEIAKFEGDWTPEQIDAGEAPAPFEVVQDEGNLLLIGGVSLLWELAIGNRAVGALEYLNNANARIGVGTSRTAGVFKAMDATYPQHTDSTGTSGSKTITFRSTFASADANQAWAEWGIDNGTRLLNRKVAANGTKASGQTWQFTVTVTIA
jgi:hypothetical protein